jgi:CDP-diacylglycerol---serine O-phosphatidyltransferase
MSIKKHIPNIITCANLLCGCLAIVKAFQGNINWAVYLVGLAALLDFFDGMAARILNVSSPIGKDLDSLSDMVSFGVVPGVILFQLLQFSYSHYVFSTLPKNNFVASEIHSFDTFLPYIAFIIPIFSALRLAKFNNDERQIEAFIGLPTPANAIFFSTLAYIILNTFYQYESAAKTLQETMLYDFEYDIIVNKLGHPYFLAGLIIAFSVLLVAEIPLFSFKFKHFKWQGNQVRWLYIGWCSIVIGLLGVSGIPLTIISYILFSMANNLLNKNANNETD